MPLWTIPVKIIHWTSFVKFRCKMPFEIHDDFRGVDFWCAIFRPERFGPSPPPPDRVNPASPPPPRSLARTGPRKGTNGVSTNGVTAILSMFFDRGIFWVLPLSYFYLPKSDRAYLFPQSVKIHYFCSGPISVDPICPQPNSVTFFYSCFSFSYRISFFYYIL